jgi:tetratricopeptide (TPR) repeat protein
MAACAGMNGAMSSRARPWRLARVGCALAAGSAACAVAVVSESAVQAAGPASSAAPDAASHPVSVGNLRTGSGPGGAASTAASPDFAAARALYQAGRYAEAQTLFRILHARAPDDPEVNFHLGRLALWFDDSARSVAYLEAAVARAPADARFQHALGDACGLTAQRANVFTRLSWAHRCRTAYLRAVELEPGNVDYRWSLMNYYEQAPHIAGGGLDRAYAEAAEIRRLDPVSGRIARANVDVAAHKYDRAFAEFEAMLRTQPDDFVALYQLGRCSAVSGERLGAGLAALRRCLQLRPPAGEGQPKYVNVHFRMGNILEKMGDAAGARAEYEEALRENPEFRAAKDAIRN